MAISANTCVFDYWSGYHPCSLILKKCFPHRMHVCIQVCIYTSTHVESCHSPRCHHLSSICSSASLLLPSSSSFYPMLTPTVRKCRSHPSSFMASACPSSLEGRERETERGGRRRRRRRRGRGRERERERERVGATEQAGISTYISETRVTSGISSDLEADWACFCPSKWVEGFGLKRHSHPKAPDRTSRRVSSKANDGLPKELALNGLSAASERPQELSNEGVSTRTNRVAAGDCLKWLRKKSKEAWT